MWYENWIWYWNISEDKKFKCIVEENDIYNVTWYI